MSAKPIVAADGRFRGIAAGGRMGGQGGGAARRPAADRVRRGTAAPDDGDPRGPDVDTVTDVLVQERDPALAAAAERAAKGPPAC